MEDFLALLERVEYEKAASAQEKRQKLEFDPNSVIDDRTQKKAPKKKKSKKKVVEKEEDPWTLAGTITDNKIVAGTILADKIEANSVTAKFYDKDGNVLDYKKIPPPQIKASDAMKGVSAQLSYQDEVQYYNVNEYAKYDAQLLKDLYMKYDKAQPAVANPWHSNHGNAYAMDIPAGYTPAKTWATSSPDEIVSDIKAWKDKLWNQPVYSPPPVDYSVVEYDDLTWYSQSYLSNNPHTPLQVTFINGPMHKKKTYMKTPLMGDYKVLASGGLNVVTPEKEESYIEPLTATYKLQITQQNLGNSMTHQVAYTYLWQGTN